MARYQYVSTLKDTIIASIILYQAASWGVLIGQSIIETIQGPHSQFKKGTSFPSWMC